MGDGEGGDVDVFVLGFGRVQEDGGDGFADGGEGGGGPFVGAAVADGGGLGLEVEFEEAGLEAPEWEGLVCWSRHER